MKERIPRLGCAVMGAAASAFIFSALFEVYYLTFFLSPDSTLAIGYWFGLYRNVLLVFAGLLAVRTLFSVSKKGPNIVFCSLIVSLLIVQSYTHWGAPLTFCLWAMLFASVGTSWMFAVDLVDSGVEFGTFLRAEKKPNQAPEPIPPRRDGSS